jgi:hypothetical protein
MALLNTRGVPAARRAPKGRGLLAVAALALAFVGARSAPAVTAESREFEVKAVFLFNFAQFVEWQPDAFPDKEAPLVIGILGNDPFGTYIDEAVRGEKVNDRSLVIRRFHSVEEVGTCQILFISKSEAPRLSEDLQALKGRSILTVSDMDDFSRSGGMIRFVMEKNKVRLRINNDAARTAGLRISSKLLRPSEVVTTEDTKP